VRIQIGYVNILMAKAPSHSAASTSAVQQIKITEQGMPVPSLEDSGW
jgi:hypothetical protein